MEPEFQLLCGLGRIALAIDVGGNWGQSIYAIKRTAKPGKIVSFEPNPILASRLAKRFSGDQSVEIRECALSNSAGRFNLYIPKYREFIYDGLASLEYLEAKNWFTKERFAFFDDRRLNIESVVVESMTLDSLQMSPDVIKIDVQGAENLVLEGGISTLERSRPFVIMENPTEYIVDILGEMGLKAYYYKNGKLIDWRLHVNNVVFVTHVHREKLNL
jgi:FkbM family methyltransferase